MYRLISAFIASFLFYCMLHSQAQQTFSNELLSSYRHHLSWKQSLDKISFQQNQHFTTPWLRDLDVQYGNRDAFLIDNLFSLRFNSNNFREWGQYQKFQDAQNKLLKEESMSLLKELLLQRYQLCLEFANYSTKTIWLDSLNQLADLRIHTMIQSLGNDKKWNFSDIVKQAADKDKWKRDSIENQLKYAEIVQQLQSLGVTIWDISSEKDQWINAEDIRLLLTQNREVEWRSQSALEKEQELNVLKVEKDLQIKREKEWNGFLQFGLRDYSNRETFEEKFFTRVGLTLPLGGLPNRRRNALDLEIFEIKDRITLSDSIRSWNINRWKNLLRSQLVQYDQIRQSEENKMISKFLQSEILMQEMPADEIIYLQIRKLEWQLDLWELEMSILSNYIEMLHDADALISMPLRNHLTKRAVPLH
ncbi:MAG: hypothetical protein IPM48_08070 [Saprospiraceae bacterium]|nr:hypothetical protein [Saprospiraceae bacterium]